MLTVELSEQQILIESFNHHAKSAIVGAPNTNKKAMTIMLRMQLLKHKNLKKTFNFHSTSATVGAQNPKKDWTIMLTVQSWSTEPSCKMLQLSC
jgi:hypothetical protein